jgi:hypothetical protein
MRERRKGNPKYIEPGYGSPREVRGATAEGFFPVIVSSLKDLANVKEGFGIIVSATVGMRKKAAILKAAAERKLRLLNADAGEFAKKTAELLSSRKKRRSELMQKRKVRGESKKPEPKKPEPAKKPLPAKKSVAPKKPEPAKKSPARKSKSAPKKK